MGGVPRKYKSYGGNEAKDEASRPATSTTADPVTTAGPSAASDEIDLTLDQVKVAYTKFVPLAAIQYLMFLPEDVDRIDVSLLERARTLIEDTFGADREEDGLEEEGEEDLRRRPDFDIDD